MPELPSPASLRDRLRDAAALEHQADRLLEVAGVVSDALADLGIRPVVVGGLAAAYWSGRDEYATDVDVLMPHDARIGERLERLGFERHGRHWLLDAAGVALEAPAAFLSGGEVVVDVATVLGGRVRIVSAEDVLLDRLRQVAHWGSSERVVQAVVLLGAAPELDRGRARELAAQEGLDALLLEVESLQERVKAGDTVSAEALDELTRRHAKRP